MKRVIIHWTAGMHYPNGVDLLHYHYLIDKDGKIHNGIFPVSANEVCKSDKMGKVLYAAHTGGGNTGSIGIALCGMCGFDLKNKKTKYPITKEQCEAAFGFIAEILKKHGISVSKQTVLTHYEFGLENPKTSSFGKIDITYLPPFPNLKENQIGDFFRQAVKETLLK